MSTAGRNGHATSLPPLTDQEAARIVVRVFRTRGELSDRDERRMPPEWAEAAIFAAEGEPGLDAWRRMTTIRLRAEPSRAQAMLGALDGALSVETPEGNAGQPGYPLTETGNAERFAHQHGRDVGFVFKWSKYLSYDGKRWAVDAEGEVWRRAKATVRSIYGEANDPALTKERATEIAAWAKTSESAKARNALLLLARSELPLALEVLDADPMLLNCQNGTVDLRTGSLRPHRREDKITKVAPVIYDPAAECPVWESFLRVIFAEKQDLVGFVRRLCGLILTGLTTEQILPILHGVGANGKSTFLTALIDMLGPDYAAKVASDLIMSRRSDSHPTGLSDLYGKRLAVAIETPENARLNEPLVKELTGSDRIRARRMREDYWEFTPTHKLLICTNHRPVISGTDHAIWRRVRLVPFEVVIPGDQQDKDLAAKLAAERPGILAWCVRGCLEWQREGLHPPKEVTEATSDYKAHEDVLEVFLTELCVRDQPDFRVKSSELYGAYRAWAESAGETVASQRKFGSAMTERGFERYTNNGIWYRGIGLRQTPKPRAEETDTLDHGTNGTNGT